MVAVAVLLETEQNISSIELFWKAFLRLFPGSLAASRCSPHRKLTPDPRKHQHSTHLVTCYTFYVDHHKRSGYAVWWRQKIENTFQFPNFPVIQEIVSRNNRMWSESAAGGERWALDVIYRAGPVSQFRSGNICSVSCGGLAAADMNHSQYHNWLEPSRGHQHQSISISIGVITAVCIN